MIKVLYPNIIYRSRRRNAGYIEVLSQPLQRHHSLTHVMLTLHSCETKKIPKVTMYVYILTDFYIQSTGLWVYYEYYYQYVNTTLILSSPFFRFLMVVSILQRQCGTHLIHQSVLRYSDYIQSRGTKGFAFGLHLQDASNAVSSGYNISKSD